MFDLLLHFVDLRHPFLLWRLSGAVHNKQKWQLFFFSSGIIQQASTAWESVNVFVYWWNMLQACRSQSRSELSSCVCSLARELSPFKRRYLWKGSHEFIMLLLTSRISSFSCSCTNPLGFSKDMFCQSSIRSSIRGHPPSSEATDALQRPPSPHGVALVNNARDL